MKKTTLLVAIATLVVLPGLAFGADPVVTVDTASLGGAGGEKIDYDLNNPADQTVKFDVLLSTDQALDAIQFAIAINPVGDTWGDSSLWMTSAAPWSMPAAFLPAPLSAGFNYLTVAAPPAPPVVNDYVSTIGDGSNGVQNQLPDLPLTRLDQIILPPSLVPTPELYLKGIGGATNVGLDMVVAHYEIQPVNRATLPVRDYVIDITANVTGLGAVWVKGVVKGPLAGQKAYIHVVPEPMSLLLLLAGLPFMRRRR